MRTCNIACAVIRYTIHLCSADAQKVSNSLSVEVIKEQTNNFNSVQKGR